MNKNVVLILGNAKRHVKIDEMLNVKISFIGPNMTSKLKPLGAGIIIFCKNEIEKKICKNIIQNEADFKK